MNIYFFFGQIIVINKILGDMVIKFMKKKERSFIPLVVIFILVLQLINLSTTEQGQNTNNQSAELTKEDINSISTLSITYRRANDSNILNNDFSKYNSYYVEKSQQKYKNLYNNNQKVSEDAKKLTNHLPDWFKYKVIDESLLKTYLANRSSLLKDEPYFSSIMEVSREFNINPILLFAITGQEQSFVPQDHVSAVKIANNPYNVFCSWQSYNTDIVDASEIACRTIINLSKDRPDSVDPLVWVNRKYSADQNWHYGVRSLYNEIVEFINE